MQIQIQGTHIGSNQSLPFVNQNKKAEEKQGDALTIHATQMTAKQAKNKQDRTKSLYEQIEKLQESMQKVRENEKLSCEAKTEQLEQMRKEIQEIQQQIAKVQQQEQETRLKEEQEKKAKEEEESLTPEEREKKANEAQQKMLAGIAVAVNHIEEARPAYAKVKAYTTEAKMGMGAKLGGNLSTVEVNGLFSKAAQYGKEMMQSLDKANSLAASAGKAVEAYQKHKKLGEQEVQKKLDENTVNEDED